MQVVEYLRRLLGPDAPVGWRISAPFVYSLELGLADGAGGARYPLGLEAWRTIVERIAPFADEVFLEGEEPLDHPEALSLLGFCDEKGFRCHLTSHGAWDEPRSLVRRLRALKRLGTLRLRFPAEPDFEYGKRIIANLTFAVDAGLDVWALFPADAVDVERLPNDVARLHGLGVKGLAICRGRDAEAARRVSEKAAALRLMGYNLALEECAPSGLAGRLPGRCRGLLGSCVVDALGNVRACRHSSAVLGSLVDGDIAAIWSSPEAEELRSRLTGTASGPYRRGCPFEEGSGGDQTNMTAETETPAVELDPSLIPLPLYHLRREPFGAVLIKGYDFVPVSPAGRRIAEAFDGRQTLRELRRRFGERAVLLAYALFCEKMLRFSQRKTETGKAVPLPHDAEADL